VKEFIPHRFLRNGHLMTIAASFWRRAYPKLSAGVPRLFQTEPGTQVRGDCHFRENPREHPTLVLLHGLEGSSESDYMLGTAEKAWVAGFNVVRLNQRNCGGTETLTESLYHSGLSCDVRAVVLELIERDRLPEIWAAGFSMGGNLVLKMAGEFADAAPGEVRGFAAVAPSFDLAACADTLELRRNFLYERHFVKRLKQRMRHKARLFPGQYANGLRGELGRVGSVREFDNRITARFCGFRDAADYYAQSSAKRVIGAIRRPTLVVTAEDDPVVPFAMFANEALQANPNISLVVTRSGGHCAFISQERGEERFWAEARVVEFCKQRSIIGR
jgi:uncharacterized protein